MVNEKRQCQNIIVLEQCRQKRFHVNTLWANDEKIYCLDFLKINKRFFKPGFYQPHFPWQHARKKNLLWLTLTLEKSKRQSINNWKVEIMVSSA